MTRAVRGLWALIAMSMRTHPWQSLVCLSETLGVVVSLAQPVALTLVVSALAAGDAKAAWIGLGLLVAQAVLSRYLFMVGLTARIPQLERMGFEFTEHVGVMVATLPTLRDLDDPATRDELRLLHDEQGSLGLAINTLLNGLNSLVTGGGVVLLAAAADPRMLIVALGGLPATLIVPLLSRWQVRADRQGATHSRLVEDLSRIALSPRAAGELRVFGLGPGLLDRIRDETRLWQQPRQWLAVREGIVTSVLQVVFFTVAGSILVWIAHDTIAGTTSIAAFVLCVLIVTQLQAATGELASSAQLLVRTARAGQRLLWLRTLHADALTNTGHEQPGTDPAPLVLTNVGYQYPGASTPALTDINVRLDPGTVVAIVGDNGAGKSTLANLLADLLPPSTGQITVGHQDLAAINPQQWRDQTSAAFQDHLRMEFEFIDTVGCGNLIHRRDQHRVENALERADARSIIDRLPHGLHTMLGTTWTAGTDLSGGQWQRIAIARGEMRHHPRVRILDEPTANLDAHTEHVIFDSITTSARAGRDTKTVTVLITHRFSTVAEADTILVLHHGRLIEQGSHDHLMTLNGHYAQVYELQAASYR